MEHSSLAGRIFRGVALALVLIFFMFPIVWILLMSLQTNEQILRIPPRLLFEPTLANYEALISGQLHTAAGNLEISFMRNLFNSFVLSSAAVLLALCRCGQGFGLGGEWGGAVLLATENAPRGKEAWYGSFPQLGAPLGFVCSTGIFLLISTTLTNSELLRWGWRLPWRFC